MHVLRMIDIYIYIPGPNPKWFRRFYTTSLFAKTRLIIRVLGLESGSSGSVGSLHRNTSKSGDASRKGLRLLLCGVTTFKTNTWMGHLSWEQELDMGALNLGNYGLCVFKMYTIYRIPLSVFND